jgi:hypothetical protein
MALCPKMEYSSSPGEQVSRLILALSDRTISQREGEFAKQRNRIAKMNLNFILNQFWVKIVEFKKA